MRIKTGVRIYKLSPELVFAHTMVLDAYRQVGVECIVTSINDGRHSFGSKHYNGDAIDYRSNSVPRNQLDNLCGLIARNLDLTKIETKNTWVGADFDLLLEGKGSPNEHIHLEFQPKGG